MSVKCAELEADLRAAEADLETERAFLDSCLAAAAAADARPQAVEASEQIRGILLHIDSLEHALENCRAYRGGA
jgi:hypothetical protein